MLDRFLRRAGLNTLLKQLAQRHSCEDVFSITSFRQVAQRPDGHPLFSGLFGDTPGRVIDGLALAERERQRFHALGLTIL